MLLATTGVLVGAATLIGKSLPFPSVKGLGASELPVMTFVAFWLMFYPAFAVNVKRAHDRNMPDWVLIAFFAANAFLDLLVVLDLAGTNENPNLLSLAVAVPLTVVGLALLVELGFRKGTEGPNQYGPDPLAKS